MATVTYAKYSDPLDEDTPEYKFTINPFVYTAYQDCLPEAREAAAVAYGLRATRETYKTV